MILRKQKDQMKREKQFWDFFLLFVLLSNGCAHVEEKVVDVGPLVEGCAIDLQAGGYQCARIDQDPFFVSFKEAKPMECIAPVDLEATLKSCRNKKIIQTMICTIIEGLPLCFDPKG